MKLKNFMYRGVHGWFPKDDQFRQIAVYPKSGITNIKKFTLKNETK